MRNHDSSSTEVGITDGQLSVLIRAANYTVPIAVRKV